MVIEKHRVVSIHYTLTNDGGDTLDTSQGRDPLSYIQGMGHLIIGLEEALEGKKKGDSLKVNIPPEKGYGERRDDLIQKVPREQFGDNQVEPGMQFQANTDGGQILVTITEVQEQEVTVDGNHPLAGQNLNFAVEITEVREATKEEIEHRHVHGPGGHEH